MEGKKSTPPPRIQSRYSSLKIIQLIGLFLVFGLGFPFLSVRMTRYFVVQSVVSTSSARSVFLPCIKEATNLNQWIRPPSNLMHSMSDQEIIWRASLVPHVKKYPFKRVPKVAFMFLTRGPLPLSPLWEKFFRGHEGLYSIYLHSLPSYRADFAPASVFYQRQIPSQILTQCRRLIPRISLRKKRVRVARRKKTWQRSFSRVGCVSGDLG